MHSAEPHHIMWGAIHTGTEKDGDDTSVGALSLGGARGSNHPGVRGCRFPKAPRAQLIAFTTNSFAWRRVEVPEVERGATVLLL